MSSPCHDRFDRSDPVLSRVVDYSCGWRTAVAGSRYGARRAVTFEHWITTMPHLVPHDHKYWCPGGWPWEWFDTCTRHGQAWQYDFEWVHSTGFLFYSTREGCENGILYKWDGPALGVGSKTE